MSVSAFAQAHNGGQFAFCPHVDKLHVEIDHRCVNGVDIAVQYVRSNNTVVRTRELQKLTDVGTVDDDTNNGMIGLEIDLDCDANLIRRIDIVASSSLNSIPLSRDNVGEVKFTYEAENGQQTPILTAQVSELTRTRAPIARLDYNGNSWVFSDCRKPSIPQTSQSERKLGRAQSRSQSKRMNARVVSGRGLAAKDMRMIGQREATSDPYYILSYKNKVTTSATIKRNLNPKWDEEPLYLGVIDENETAPLDIKLFDKDFLSRDDFMGSAKVSVSSLYALSIGTHYLTFQLERSQEKCFEEEEVSGEIVLEIVVRDMPRANDLRADSCRLPLQF